ncbi:hypothetical protein PROFUN_13285 [Planoprotostelium fungivorum]|uniref:Uncharacterized protein n=1 Tax=Planoprotostelium fungivorum TaxID=1890364 RepID=A0A2P6N4M0_9EUKA|nr:hypothetical protein PROFUN_13285 [Planoprotostelium fungivorum]
MILVRKYQEQVLVLADPGVFCIEEFDGTKHAGLSSFINISLSQSRSGEGNLVINSSHVLLAPDIRRNLTEVASGRKVVLDGLDARRPLVKYEARLLTRLLIPDQHWKKKGLYTEDL